MIGQNVLAVVEQTPQVGGFTGTVTCDMMSVAWEAILARVLPDRVGAA